MEDVFEIYADTLIYEIEEFYYNKEIERTNYIKENNIFFNISNKQEEHNIVLFNSYKLLNKALTYLYKLLPDNKGITKINDKIFLFHSDSLYKKLYYKTNEDIEVLTSININSLKANENELKNILINDLLNNKNSLLRIIKLMHKVIINLLNNKNSKLFYTDSELDYIISFNIEEIDFNKEFNRIRNELIRKSSLKSINFEPLFTNRIRNSETLTDYILNNKGISIVPNAMDYDNLFNNKKYILLNNNKVYKLKLKIKVLNNINKDDSFILEDIEFSFNKKVFNKNYNKYVVDNKNFIKTKHLYQVYCKEIIKIPIIKNSLKEDGFYNIINNEVRFFPIRNNDLGEFIVDLEKYDIFINKDKANSFLEDILEKDYNIKYYIDKNEKLKKEIKKLKEKLSNSLKTKFKNNNDNLLEYFDFKSFKNLTSMLMGEEKIKEDIIKKNIINNWLEKGYYWKNDKLMNIKTGREINLEEILKEFNKDRNIENIENSNIIDLIEKELKDIKNIYIKTNNENYYNLLINRKNKLKTNKEYFEFLKKIIKLKKEFIKLKNNKLDKDFDINKQLFTLHNDILNMYNNKTEIKNVDENDFIDIENFLQNLHNKENIDTYNKYNDLNKINEDDINDFPSYEDDEVDSIIIEGKDGKPEVFTKK